MAHYAAKAITADFELGGADFGRGIVSRYRLHVTAISGTLTVKAKIAGSTTTPIAANVVTSLGSTTTGSTITTTGQYDIDCSGLSILLSPATSATFDVVGLIG